MGREEDIEKIVERGRQTRRPTPRWLWIASLIVGGLCLAGVAIAMLGDRDPTHKPVERRPAGGSGLGIGLVIGAGVGIVIGLSIARQRRSHSSRNRP